MSDERSVTSNAPTAKKRSDYQVPDFFIEQVDMTFWLEPTETRVLTRSKVRRNGDHQRPLVLDGDDLELLKVSIDGIDINTYQCSEKQLSIAYDANEFELEIETQINPASNTSLEGLYLSNNTFSTQCEAEGFRKITYFLDRPDVLATYQVTVHADKQKYPYLLSNGNCIAKGEGDNGTHWVTWQDPFKKPCYLFALVAGDFDLVEDKFVTQSGRTIDLQFFVDKGNASRAGHAVESLKKAMRWDEETFGLEYDLDIYMVVAVDFFNMGAMENKGLNIFNSKCVLADPESATDEDYFNIESIIGHEYFHNWTGNRVTCRDWFQLSLKEGLTVFRDQQFSSDMSSPVTTRISQVKLIKERQFAEDSGPMSHPIRPDEVIEMNNFYTVTVYDKGAEVIRMMHTMLGKDGFRRGMDLYFERHDGQAVTCDDFVNAMQDANNVDMSLFRRWYGQSGTPEVSVKEVYDAEQQLYRIELSQHTPKTADQEYKQVLHIPVDMMLLNARGEAESLDHDGNISTVLDLCESKQSFVFHGIKEKPVLDIFRGFSAPVKVHFEQSTQDMAAIMLHARDDFSRWEASQNLFTDAILNGVKHQGVIADSKIAFILDCLKQLLQNKPGDFALLGEMLSVPSYDSLAQKMDIVDVEGIVASRKLMQDSIADALSDELLTAYGLCRNTGYAYQQEQIANRRLSNVCLTYLAKGQQGEQLLLQQFKRSDNMTDTLGVLKAARRYNVPVFEKLMSQFESRWHDDVLVLDKWFSLHAGAETDDILAKLDLLTAHAHYSASNPNRIRAVVGTFAFFNTSGFHNMDGSGYRYVADAIIQLNSVNPQVASRLITPLSEWQRYGEDRQDLMKGELLRIADQPHLSPDLYEKVSKALHF